MDGMKELHILAFPVSTALDEEDEGVPGVYSVQVKQDLPLESQASAALDVFHSERAVGVLDDFEFYVLDPVTGQVLTEDENHESYSLKSAGADVCFITETLPRIYATTVSAVGDDRSVSGLGTVLVVAKNKLETAKKALGLLWDQRLDAASCSPRFSHERIK